jgi:hypothetical protein
MMAGREVVWIIIRKCAGRGQTGRGQGAPPVDPNLGRSEPESKERCGAPVAPIIIGSVQDSNSKLERAVANEHWLFILFQLTCSARNDNMAGKHGKHSMVNIGWDVGPGTVMLSKGATEGIMRRVSTYR